MRDGINAGHIIVIADESLLHLIYNCKLYDVCYARHSIALIRGLLRVSDGLCIIIMLKKKDIDLLICYNVTCGEGLFTKSS